MKIQIRSLAVIVCILLIISCKNDEGLILFKVTITNTDGGSVNVNSGEYQEGTVITMEAIPNSGFIFSGWTGDISSNENVLTVTIMDDLNLTANFLRDPIEPNQNVVFLNQDKIDNTGYVFAIPGGGTEAYLLGYDGERKYEWQFSRPLGQDLELLPNGNLMGLFQAESPTITFGGKGGVLREIDPESNIVWEYEINNQNEILHHDFTVIPNGNILALVWYRIDNDVAQSIGLNNTGDIFMERVIEIDRSTNQIIWEWDSWDHIVQDFNNNLENFGNPESEKNKINILYANNDTHPFVAQGDLIHINGIAYHSETDIIALSANFFSEVWFIDHSTSTSQARTSTGGQFNKGGDLLYRFGNQKVYGDNSASNIFDYNHHPSFVTKNGSLSLLIFNNNNVAQQSRAMEFLLPEINGNTEIGGDPQLLFDYTNQDLFFSRVSGAVRLPNGNTLICEGDYGYWEVTPDGELVWKYEGSDNNFWRGLYYTKDSDALVNLAERSTLFSLN